ncbi:hypothetical protein VD0004_g2994 [Verticillium dahliae]|nr:hypothetical protein VD0004_g2994 [Verticillium dahliae]
MDRRTKQKSCYPCVDSKRRCDRTLPSCTRCIDRGVQCAWPGAQQRRLGKPAPEQSESTNPAFTSVHGDDNRGTVAGQEPPSISHHTAMHETMFMISPPHGISPMPDADHDAPHNSGLASSTISFGSSTSPASVAPGAGTSSVGTNVSPSTGQNLKWFTHPSTWTIGYHYQLHEGLPSPQAFSDFIRGLQCWVRRFQREGHSPLIHRQLYPARAIPDCIQDAYAAIAVAEGVCPENENLVDSIANSLVMRLISSYPQMPAHGLSIVTTADHLARTQALLIHIILALFSSSISRQAKAESLIETLHRWKLALWESASQEASLVDMFPFVQADPLGSGEPAGESVPELHRAFIMCESIRRTWLVSAMTIGVYRSLRGDWSSACAGDVLFTSRAGLWDAFTSARWAAIAEGEDPLFDYSLASRQLAKRDLSVAEVDEFALHLYSLMWGADTVESWFVRT